MQPPADNSGEQSRVDELRLRARRNAGSGSGKKTSWPLLVVLLFAGMVFVASIAVYFVNNRAVSYGPETRAQVAKPALPVSPSIRLPVDQVEAVGPGHDDGSNLYKCKGPKGESTYANSPCPANYETVWVRSIPPDNRTLPPPSASARDPGVQPPQAQIVYAAPEQPSESEKRRIRCANARQYEADTRRRRGLKITFDELRRLSDMVYEACKPQQ